MFSLRRWSSPIALFAGLTLITSASAYTQQICSGLNTASTNKNSSIYQSGGLCHDFCIDSYAFAVVQYDGCWCSNYAPSVTADGCNTQCPGYPSELCGGNNLFGYIALALAPSGTRGPPQSAAASTSSRPVSVTSVPPTMTVTATPDAVTIISTVTPDIPTPSPSETSTSSTTPSATSTTSTTTTPTTTSTPSTSSSTSDVETSSTWTPTPVTSLETITGSVRTVTVTPTVPPNSQNLNSVSKNSGGGGGLSTGGAVGLTIGLVVLIATIALMAWYYMRKRKQEKEDAFANLSRANSVTGQLGSAGGGVPSRTMSENSRYVLNTNGRQVVEAWEPETGGRQNRLVPVDPRLDPFAPLYQRDNKSRDSINTLRDDQDYSRRVQQPRPVLRVNNPDTE